ncbi:MAG: transposase [Bacteroidales bacterium]|nr:transposase [Bacteroidales bacterium]
MKRQRKVRRVFSTSFKREKVELIEQGKLSVKDLSLIYEVSDRAIYNWLKKYSRYNSGERIVVEKISEEKKNKELMLQIRELERALGRKQLELDYCKEVIAVITEEEGEDVVKKYKPKQ